MPIETAIVKQFVRKGGDTATDKAGQALKLVGSVPDSIKLLDAHRRLAAVAKAA